MGEYVTIKAADGGEFAAYVAAPKRERAPGLVLGQYICGVNAAMRKTADMFAQQGFLTIVPDLFWRQEPGVTLNDDPARPVPEQMAKALQLNAGFDDEKGLQDLRSTLRHVRHRNDCNGSAGYLGYCLGGRMAFLMAISSDADAIVCYYGVDIRKYLAQAGSVRRPLMLHFGGNDEHCSNEEREEIYAALSSNPDVTLHTYPGAGHQFALPGARHFDPQAAAEADRRSVAFLSARLAEARQGRPA